MTEIIGKVSQWSHNKRKQSDQNARYALILTAVAGR